MMGSNVGGGDVCEVLHNGSGQAIEYNLEDERTSGSRIMVMMTGSAVLRGVRCDIFYSKLG